MMAVKNEMTPKRMRTTEPEGYQGLGRRLRQEMIRRWKKEGQPQGLSLKEWAKQTGIGDAAFVWFEAKKAG